MSIISAIHSDDLLIPWQYSTSRYHFITQLQHPITDWYHQTFYTPSRQAVFYYCSNQSIM